MKLGTYNNNTHNTYVHILKPLTTIKYITLFVFEKSVYEYDTIPPVIDKIHYNYYKAKRRST